jgi:hypothetical protein
MVNGKKNEGVGELLITIPFIVILMEKGKSDVNF